MPTDPFVATELDDAPRHRQNLPAGVGYPPARRARTGRVGDLGSGQPDGPLLGSPGPNIGYALTLAARVRDRLALAPHESADDAVSVIAEVAMRRAAMFGRAPVKPDVDLAIALLGYDGSASLEVAVARSHAVHHAEHDYATRRGVVDLVTCDLLRAPADDPDAAADWRAAAFGTSAQADLVALARSDQATVTG